jgi:hypothetical protein
MFAHASKKLDFVLEYSHPYLAGKTAVANIFGTEIFGYFYFVPIVAGTHLSCQNRYFPVG